jgi:hypothetical protein
MSTQNNDNTAKFINSMILLFVGGIVAIAVLGFVNGAINWTGVVIMIVFIGLLLAYRGRVNKNTK